MVFQLPNEIYIKIINYIDCNNKIKIKLISKKFKNLNINCFFIKYFTLKECSIHGEKNLIDAITKLKNAQSFYKKNIKIKYLHFINKKSLKIAYNYLWHFGYISDICCNGTGIIYNDTSQYDKFRISN